MQEAKAFGSERTARESELLQAAIEVFLEHGFDKATIDQVARKGGYSKATIYKQHVSKERLFRNAVEYACEIIRPVRCEASSQEPSLIQELTEFGENFLQMMWREDTRRLRFVIAAEANRFPELGEAFLNAGPRRDCDYLAGVLRKHQIKNGIIIQNARSSADRFLSSLLGIPDLEICMGLRPMMTSNELRRHVSQSVDLFLHGVAANPVKNEK
ncbi:MAG: TetR/AcrR family transcriptional regulator [Parvularculaceae bacterium]